MLLDTPLGTVYPSFGPRGGGTLLDVTLAQHEGNDTFPFCRLITSFPLCFLLGFLKGNWHENESVEMEISKSLREIP